MKFLSNLDLTRNQLLNAVLQLLASDPGTPNQGQVWFNTVENAFRGYDGTNNRMFTRGIDVTGAAQKTGTDDRPSITVRAATGSVDGTMSAADKTKLDDASVSATASTLVIRDANGRAQFAEPASANDAATKNYVDNATLGLKWKEPVRVATTANITLSGTQTIDSVSVVADDRVLVRAQTNPAENGVWVVASGAWARATDFDSGTEVVNGTMLVSEGTTYADTQWTMSANAPIVVGTDAMTFSQMTGGTAVTAGNGLTQTGNTIDVGTASASRIVVNADNIDLATTGVSAGSYSNVTVDTYGRVTGGSNAVRFAQDVGDNSTTSIVVTHNLNTRDVMVQLYDNSTYETLTVDADRTTVNSVTLNFSVAPTTNQYRVLIG